MNIFLLFAAPVMSFLIIWHFLDTVPKDKVVLNLATSFVWAFLAFFALLPFGGLARFTGNLVEAFFGTWIVQFLLPSALILAAFSWRHIIIKKAIPDTQGQQLLRLTFWLGFLFTLQGVSDFFWYNRTYDMSELFFIPLLRGLLLAWLPILFLYFWNAKYTSDKVRWSVAAGGLTVASAGCMVVSYAQWGLVVWLILIAGYAATWFGLKSFYRK